MAINFVDGKYVDEKGIVKLDPTVYKDWQIAEEAEKTLPPVDYFREKLGLLPEEIIPYGKTPKPVASLWTPSSTRTGRSLRKQKRLCPPSITSVRSWACCPRKSFLTARPPRSTLSRL